LSPEQNVIIIATANSTDSLDPALRRAGRFDKELEIRLPVVSGRTEILGIYTSSFTLADDINLEQIALSIHGYSGADIELLCKDALWHAIKRQIPFKNLEGLSKDMGISAQFNGIIVNEMDFLECAKDINPTLGRAIIAEIPEVAWEDIGGYNDVKMQLEKDVIGIWSHRSLSKNLGVKMSYEFACKH
jgi:transitional endoplasmic reticulum ATPase